MLEDAIMTNPLAIIGREDVISGFRALGFKVYALNDSQEFRNILEEIVNEKIVACLVQDDIYHRYELEINNYRSSPLPIFIPFSQEDKTDLLDKMIRDIRLKATGTF